MHGTRTAAFGDVIIVFGSDQILAVDAGRRECVEREVSSGVPAPVGIVQVAEGMEIVAEDEIRVLLQAAWEMEDSAAVLCSAADGGIFLQAITARLIPAVPQFPVYVYQEETRKSFVVTSALLQGRAHKLAK